MRPPFRFAVETPQLRKCAHGDLSRVHTVFGCEPNRAYCNAQCFKPRAKQLTRDAMRRSILECDFCHQPAGVTPVVFAVAAVVVRAGICAPCLLGVR
jgi:hypothetical protein